MAERYDLWTSLGLSGQLVHPEVRSAIDHVTRAGLEGGVHLGIPGLTAEALKQYIQRGYTLIVARVDIMMPELWQWSCRALSKGIK